MTKADYLTKVADTKINATKVDEINKIYGAGLPDELKRIISVAEESIFLDSDYRILSVDEIKNASKELHVDFKGSGLIPLVDCGENDFIVYNFKTKTWSKFNIIDEAIFKKSDSFESLLK